jgi:hypothetical protein
MDVVAEGLVLVDAQLNVIFGNACSREIFNV